MVLNFPYWSFFGSATRLFLTSRFPIGSPSELNEAEYSDSAHVAQTSLRLAGYSQPPRITYGMDHMTRSRVSCSHDSNSPTDNDDDNNKKQVIALRNEQLGCNKTQRLNAANTKPRHCTRF
jgi:hypothetical protein